MITMHDIIRDGNPTLRARAKELKFPLSDEEKKFGQNMMEYLINSQDEKIAKKYHLRAGVGLAAPQVDVSKRMAAVLVPGPNDKDIIFKAILVNPTILSESVQLAGLAEGEGCLSVDKDVPGYVLRHDRIKLRWYDLDGNEHVQRLKDYPAIVCQHEIDHLNGTLFYDHIQKKEPFAAPDDAIIIG